jgi:flagellar biosynthesis/type III secretory pathway protein FliH
MKKLFPLFLIATVSISTTGCKKKYQEGYDAGYSQGHTQGHDETYQSGYSDGNADGMANGYDNGYAIGHTDGYGEGWEESRDLYATDEYELGFIDGNRIGFQDGFAIGNADGLVDGAADGATDGYNHGYNTGYNLGYNDGEDDGFDVGYSHGYSDGYSDGSVDGYDTGYDDGYDERWWINYDNGYDDGYDEGWDDGDYDGYGDGYDDGWDDAYSYYSSTASKNPMVKLASTLNADLIDYSKLAKFDSKNTIETGLVFAREGRSVDMEKLAALKQQHYLNEMSKQLEARFGLSRSSSNRIATIAHQYNLLGNTRELTAEDASNFSKELIGFDMNQIQNAFKKSMKGDSKELNSLLNSASSKVGTSAEKFNQMINEIFF